MRSTSAGVGVAIAAAVRAGFRVISLGLGGTAVVDGGAGALVALGCTFADADGAPIPPEPRALGAAVRVDLRPAQRLLADVELRLLADVDTAYTASSTHFGAQKGLTDADRPAAAAAMARLVTLAEQANPVGGADLLRTRSMAPWWGAGGGIGLGLSTVAKASAVSGASAVLELVDPEDRLGWAPLVVTAEGAIDRSTWSGKAPGAIVAVRTARGLPTALVAARIDARRDHPQLGWQVLAPDDGSPLDERLADAGAAAVRWFAATYGEVPA
jgi:glycerate kinase